MSLINLTLDNGEEILLNTRSIYKVTKNKRVVYGTRNIDKKFLFIKIPKKELVILEEKELAGCVIYTNNHDIEYGLGSERISSWKEREVLTVKEDYDDLIKKINKGELNE